MSLMAELSARTDLSDLVRRRRAELGIGQRDLAARCIDPETGQALVSFAWISKIERGLSTVDAPKLPTLRALAAGLSVPLRVVQQAAAAQFMGVEPNEDAIWSQDHSARVVVARMSELSAEDREQLAAMVELFTRGKLPPPTGGDQQ